MELLAFLCLDDLLDKWLNKKKKYLKRVRYKAWTDNEHQCPKKNFQRPPESPNNYRNEGVSRILSHHLSNPMLRS